MKRSVIIFAIVLLAGITVFAQEASTIQKVPLSQAQIDKIVAKFTSNEKLFREALSQYNFTRSATVQTVGLGGNITGTFRRDSELIVTPEGERMEKVLFAPVSTLTEIIMRPEDFEDLGGVNPFAIDPARAASYNFTYLGKEKIDELNLFVFDVQPKVMPDFKKTKERLFSGRIWVDDTDLFIVKTKGKGVPENKDNKFPIVETWRENVDGKYWFPSYTAGDDSLVFGSGQVVRLHVRVKYNSYKMGHSEVKIIGEDDTPEPTPTPKKP